MKKEQPIKRVASRMNESFCAKDVHVSAGGTPIVRGVTCTIRPGEIHFLMGPNGSGKSTFLNALFGNPRCTLTQGSIKVGRKDLSTAPVHERARAGLFLGFQEPVEIPGVNVGSFLRTAKNTINEQVVGSKHLTPMEFSSVLKDALRECDMDNRFGGRALNEGFSGGEKKKNELLQMVVLRPRFAFLDEFDSGLDIDALKTAARVIAKSAREQGTGFLLISHNPRIPVSLTPVAVHIMMNGRIVKSGGPELMKSIEKNGYEQFET